ncbi:O-antigen ligase family protein [Hymenobacter rubripertinctus]|uniref:O-antigen ligase domain-containing protein n=1 Tax=Hymenobacter rubripertinctus TaxID=2029981 RepID=A0A418R9R6_9BACT|nr:O-antigen ligase family protein [Hymenobacter rubripertinctus]RIY14213.1 O-antigen ligase domain-containing protein [Hymenobacter rubripertinctus]
MKSFWGLVMTRERLLLAATLFGTCIIIGLFTSKYIRILPSIGMVGFTLTALIQCVLHGSSPPRASRSVYGAFGLVYLVHLAAGLTTSEEGLDAFRQDLILQLPYLLLPLGFWLLPPLPTSHLRGLWLTLVAAASVAAILSTGNYLLHFEQINEAYLHSKVMPTEPDHIRFSLLVTLAITAGVALLAHRSIGSQWGRAGLWTTVMLLAFYQHLLAVRSGLVSFYVVGGAALLWLLFRSRQYQQALVLAACLVLIPGISYSVFPTLQNKSANTQEDMSRVHHTQSANNYSLVGRVYSYKVALKVIRAHPWLGVGKGDMASEMAVYYRRDFPNIEPEAYILPHNQYLYSAVAFGISGLLIFIVGFYYAGISVWPRYAPLLLAQYLILTVSFLVEYTLETQVGLGFALFFLLLALEGSKSVSDAETTWRPA